MFFYSCVSSLEEMCTDKTATTARLESDPEALKVREWRHKLQKTFLSSNKALPKEEVRIILCSFFRTGLSDERFRRCRW